MRPAAASTASAATTVLRDDAGTMRTPPNGFSMGVSGPTTPLGGGPAFAHYDDIKNVQLQVSSLTPIETLLRHAEGSIKQARFLKDFGRVDMAVKEYIKANIILVELLPTNASWMAVMGDQKGARARYNALMAQVMAESAEYDKIKELIRKDNERSGVRPKNAPAAGPGTAGTPGTPGTPGRPHTPGTPQHERARSIASHNPGNVWPQVPTGLPDSKANGGAVRPKPKPSIQPKPQALQGKALKPGGTPSSSGKSAQDLTERFANLRASKQPPPPTSAPTSEPKQDPRIRTQPINQTSFPQQPLQQQSTPSSTNQFQMYRVGSRQSAVSVVSSSRPDYPPLIGSLPDLPKVPDAIYSPARGSVSGQPGQPPPAAAKGMFSRTNSTTSFSGMTRTPAARPSSSEDYFSLRTSSERPAARPTYQEPPPVRKPRVSIPEGDTITVQELLKCMKAGSRELQLLLIDIRSREEFDESHILSQATICIESDTLRREHVSAGDIADSMVLAPETEKRLFDRRREFDLVVYYDQDSEAMRLYGDDLTGEDQAVVALYNALAYYDFQYMDSENNKRPKLLRGGLDAWMATVGPSSLQTSTTVASAAARTAPAAARTRTSALSRQSKYMAKPIQDAAEAKRWEESLLDKSTFVRTTEDFLRRFPPVSAVQESMTSVPVDEEVSTALLQSLPAPRSPPPPPPTDVVNMYSALPAPPARPAPTVPKPSHNGLLEADEDDEDHYIRTKLAKVGAASGGSGGAGGGRGMRRQQVGLYNPGNWCYGNSSFQSLFASGSFAEELITGEWAAQWKVPMKSDEKISHPQLLTKILANAFHWMQFGKFEAMKAKTLMEYCYHIHSHDFDGSTKADRSTIFGGPYQQDAQEFISFLLTNLHDETNRLRDRTDEVPQPAIEPQSTALGNGLQFWEAYRRCNDSLVDRYWRGVEVTDRRCRSCGHPSLTYEPFDALHLPLPSTGGDTATLSELLASYCSADLLPEYKCDECRRTDTTDKRARFVRLPDLLCVSFRRFQGNEHCGFRKNNTAVVFPVDGLDMTPYTVQAKEPAPPAADAPFAGPFVYDCYAVIVHSGTLRSGHYRAYVRDEAAPASYQWHHFDDARVEPVTIGSGDGRDMARRLYRDSSQASAYVVFYKRRK